MFLTSIKTINWNGNSVLTDSYTVSRYQNRKTKPETCEKSCSLNLDYNRENIPRDSISIKFSNKLVIFSHFIAQERKRRPSGSFKQRQSLLLFTQKNIWDNFRHIFKLLRTRSRDIFQPIVTPFRFFFFY